MDSALLGPTVATPVALAAEISDASWEAYQREVWTARLDAHMHAAYWQRACRWLRGLETTLGVVTTLGSLATFGTLVARQPGWIAGTVALIVAVCAAFQTVAKLSDRAARASDLVQGWTARATFWDDAWIHIQNGEHLGPVGALRTTETALQRAASELHFPRLRSWERSIMDMVERSDPQRART